MNIPTSPLLRAGIVALLLCANAHAAPNASPGGMPPGPPPPEALAACKSLKANQACTFGMGSGTITGTCWAPEGKPLACKPKDAPNAPPPQK